MSMIGILGGTFDPIHKGHLYVACTIAQILPIKKCLMIPCKTPPHRDLPIASAHQRATMVERAIAPYPELSLDTRELQREGPSYMVDTLSELSSTDYQEDTLNLILGIDAFLGLAHWHQAKRLKSLCNIILVDRPGFSLAHHENAIKSIASHIFGSNKALRKHRDLLDPTKEGQIVTIEIKPPNISATQIRQKLREHSAGINELPEEVLRYIHEHHLYQP